jgi:hypothetical protein
VFLNISNGFANPLNPTSKDPQSRAESSAALAELVFITNCAPLLVGSKGESDPEREGEQKPFKATLVAVTPRTILVEKLKSANPVLIAPVTCVSWLILT